MPRPSRPRSTGVVPSGVTVAYTDGACRGNPGPGGWAWAVPGGAWASGHDPATTNQRMEILAAYQAVLSIEGPVHIVSDSTYVVNCFRDGWWKGWLARGWKNSKKEPVANRDLWEPFIELVQERDVTWDWVKGHSGDPMNDLVDRLAVAASYGRDGSGDEPPSEDDLGPADTAGRPAKVSAAAPDTGSSPARDSRIPEGTPYAVVGVRSDALAGTPAGDVLRRQLAAILGAQHTLHPDLVVLSGLRPGAEELGAAAAVDAGVPYVAVLPYPDPVAGWPETARAGFDAGCAAARSVVTLEKKRPADADAKRKAIARRDGWLRSVSAGAVVVTDGVDAEAELALRRFTDALGDDVWSLEIDRF